MVPPPAAATAPSAQTPTLLLIDSIDDMDAMAAMYHYSYGNPMETRLSCSDDYYASDDANDLDATTKFIADLLGDEGGASDVFEAAVEPVAPDADDARRKLELPSSSAKARRKRVEHVNSNHRAQDSREAGPMVEIERLKDEASFLRKTLTIMRQAQKEKALPPSMTGTITNISRCHTEVRKQRRLLLHAEHDNRKLKSEMRIQKERARSLFRILMKRLAKFTSLEKQLHCGVHCAVSYAPNSAPFADTNGNFPWLLAETNAMVEQVDAMNKLLREKVTLPTRNGSFREWRVNHESSSGARLELIDSEELPFPRSHVNRAIEAMYRAYEVTQTTPENFNASDGTMMTTTLWQFTKDDTIEYTRQWQVVRSFITDAASVFVSTMLFEPMTDSWEPIAGTKAKMQEWRFVSNCDGGTTVQETIAITSFETSSPAKMVLRGFPYTQESMDWTFSMTNRLLETLSMKKQPKPMIWRFPGEWDPRPSTPRRFYYRSTLGVPFRSFTEYSPPEIHGIELQAAGCATEVRIGGYAVDTTIYLSDPKDINAVFAILDKYGAASGLRVNRHKSAVLPLNKEYSSTEESVSNIHVLQREEHCRYLGIQVGQTPSNASNWSKCIQALRVRLRLARLKTHSVAQRAAIASAVIMPKVLYVARHSWPSTAIVNQLHDLVKQFVWAQGTVIGEILLHNTRASSTYITPLDAIPRRPLQLRDNMWTTGAALCASLHSRPYEPRERDNVRWCYEHFKSTIVQTQWDGDVFQIDLSSKMSDRLPGIIAEGRKLRGTFCAEWLPYMTSTADGWLLDSNGSPYKLAHTSLSVGTAQLGDIPRWEWIRPGVLNFIPTCGISGFSRPSIRTLERLCAALVSNFPQLLYRPQQTNVLRLYNGQRHYNHEWHLHTSEATLTHVDTTLVKATHTVHSAMDCDIMATRDLNGQKEKADLSCSNPECSQVVQSSVQHLFWECPKAKLVWNYFYALWAKIGITPGHDPAIWIFSLDLPDTPRHAWITIKRHIIRHKFSNEHLQDHLYPVAHMLWRYMSASLIQTIWCAHLRRMDSDPIESTAEMAIMMTRLETGMRSLTRLAEAQAGDSDGHTVAAVLKAYVDCFLSQTDTIPLTPSDTRGFYLLFFDGGSRSNPGPGGTGSIIVRVHKDSHTASLIWAASMAYSRKDTTNNFAEYWGLIHGLREAQRSHLEPLHIYTPS
ncbi:hypothetical protein FI667_g3023, partial [Globisporangium splendens]